MPAYRSTRAHTPAIGAWSVVVGFCLLALLVSPARAEQIRTSQSPWVGWVGPWADGIMGFRFGMDPASVQQLASGKKLQATGARSGTLHYMGKLAGRDGDLVLEFTVPKQGLRREQLSRILISWDEMRGISTHAIKLFDLLDKLLAKRYGSPIFHRDPSISEINSGYKEKVHIYQGEEMYARLMLLAASTDILRVSLILTSPQLYPDF